MTITWSQLLHEINELFIEVTRDKIFKKETDNFREHVKVCLKLNKSEDWDFILASEDILEDSNAAIEHFLTFGLSGVTKLNLIGEKYLRLYGLLNATYLQQQAIINIHKYSQCLEQQAVRDKIDKLEIRDLRHKLGAHSADYSERDTNNLQAFVPVRIEMDDFKCDYFNHAQDSYHKVNVKDAVEEHLKLMSSIYYDILLKVTKTIYKCNPEKIESILKLASPFKAMLDGDSLIKISESNEFIIIKSVSANKI